MKRKAACQYKLIENKMATMNHFINFVESACSDESLRRTILEGYSARFDSDESGTDDTDDDEQEEDETAWDRQTDQTRPGDDDYGVDPEYPDGRTGAPHGAMKHDYIGGGNVRSRRDRMAQGIYNMWHKPNAVPTGDLGYKAEMTAARRNAGWADSRNKKMAKNRLRTIQWAKRPAAQKAIDYRDRREHARMTRALRKGAMRKKHGLALAVDILNGMPEMVKKYGKFTRASLIVHADEYAKSDNFLLQDIGKAIELSKQGSSLASIPLYSMSKIGKSGYVKDKAGVLHKTISLTGGYPGKMYADPIRPGMKYIPESSYYDDYIPENYHHATLSEFMSLLRSSRSYFRDFAYNNDPWRRSYNGATVKYATVEHNIDRAMVDNNCKFISVWCSIGDKTEIENPKESWDFYRKNDYWKKPSLVVFKYDADNCLLYEAEYSPRQIDQIEQDLSGNDIEQKQYYHDYILAKRHAIILPIFNGQAYTNANMGSLKDPAQARRPMPKKFTDRLGGSCPEDENDWKLRSERIREELLSPPELSADREPTEEEIRGDVAYADNEDDTLSPAMRDIRNKVDREIASEDRLKKLKPSRVKTPRKSKKQPAAASKENVSWGIPGGSWEQEEDYDDDNWITNVNPTDEERLALEDDVYDDGDDYGELNFDD